MKPAPVMVRTVPAVMELVLTDTSDGVKESSYRMVQGNTPRDAFTAVWSHMLEIPLEVTTTGGSGTAVRK
jgi:hypothetical protein